MKHEIGVHKGVMKQYIVSHTHTLTHTRHTCTLTTYCSYFTTFQIYTSSHIIQGEVRAPIFDLSLETVFLHQVTIPGGGGGGGAYSFCESDG